MGFGAAYPLRPVINGDRAGSQLGKRRRLDGRHHCFVFPDWVQINFNGQKTIDHVIRLYDAGQLREPGRSAELR